MANLRGVFWKVYATFKFNFKIATQFDFVFLFRLFSLIVSFVSFLLSRLIVITYAMQSNI